MKLTRQQRINNSSSTIVNTIRGVAQQARTYLEEGVHVKAEDGYPELKATGAEIREALGDNAKNVDIFIKFVLDGKTNEITRAVKKK